MNTGRPFNRIDMTPLVGVLLALFAAVALLGASSSEAAGVVMDVPGCNLPAPGVDPPARPLFVSVLNDGSIYVLDKRVERSGLQAALIEASSHKAAAQRVYVRADADVPYGVVYAAYQDVQKAGLGSQIGLVSEDIE